MAFKDINIMGGKWTLENGKDILVVEEPHALIMAAGYLKYNSKGGVYFRGQSCVYDDMRPSLYRGINSETSRCKKERKLKNKIEEYKSKCEAVNRMSSHVIEPLLQHYGLQTTWLDVVDNIWVALWFSCYKAVVTKDGYFLHFKKRDDIEMGYAYIYLISADLDKRDRSKPGFWNGRNTELIDLRIAAPSYFLRPHAQHGLLFRCKGDGVGRTLDYSRQVKGIVKIELKKALKWLGNGDTINTHSLFPPAFYDNGYKILLQCGVAFDHKDREIGVIYNVGA